MRVRPSLLLVACTALTCLLPKPALADDSEADPVAEPDEATGENEHSEAETHAKAEAQGAMPKSGAIALTLAATLVSYSQLSFVLSPKDRPEMSGTLTNTAWGLSTNPVTIEVAYGLSSHAFLGLLLELGGSTLSTKIKDLGIDQELSAARFLVGPKFEFLFSDSGKVRPFVLGVTGFTWAPQQNTSQSISLTGFQALAGVGLHWHLTENFSIDPALRAGGGIGWGRVNQDVYRNVPAHGSLLTAGFVIGATGWIL
jgi:hypothetical protein